MSPMGMGMPPPFPYAPPPYGYPPQGPPMDPAMMYGGCGWPSPDAMGKGGKRNSLGGMRQGPGPQQVSRQQPRPMRADGGQGEVVPDIPEEQKTTVMLKNIPNDYKRGDVK